MVKDLVCNMDINPETAKFKSKYEGKSYYFCAKHCKMTFEKEPTSFVNK